MGLKEKLASIFKRSSVEDSFWTEFEETLIGADVGVAFAHTLIDVSRKEKTIEGVKRSVAEQMMGIFVPAMEVDHVKPKVVLIIGVNGAGKTTTIAKLAKRYQGEGKRVLLVAADTFRAAAVEQLKEWGARLKVEVVAQGPGADAAAVAFDGVAKAVAKDHDVVIIDTAGRLHNKQNLVEELKKISRVTGKSCSGAPHEKVLILDATVGSNGFEQALKFHEAIGLTGVIVTKLDGTAKGGVIFQVASELKIPITHVGVGEGMEDLKPFDAKDFVDSILS